MCVNPLFMFTIYYASDPDAQCWFVDESIEKALAHLEVIEEVHNISFKINGQISSSIIYDVQAVCDYKENKHNYTIWQEPFVVGRYYS